MPPPTEAARCASTGDHSDSLHLFRGVAEVALYCAHRTNTFLSCAFCEQEGHLVAPSHPCEGAAPSAGSVLDLLPRTNTPRINGQQAILRCRMARLPIHFVVVSDVEENGAGKRGHSTFPAAPDQNDTGLLDPIADQSGCALLLPHYIKFACDLRFSYDRLTGSSISCTDPIRHIV